MADMFGPYPGIVRDWHDGDTCHVDLDLGFGVELRAYDLEGKPRISCRIWGINAPELSAADGSGLASLAHAQQICPANTKVLVMAHGWDKYGSRFDAQLTLPDGTDFGTAMINAGFAVALTS